MKSISSFMLIGMLFAISGVNTSDVINKCSDLAVHCKTLSQVKFTVFSCTCTIWTLSGKGLTLVCPLEASKPSSPLNVFRGRTSIPRQNLDSEAEPRFRGRTSIPRQNLDSEVSTKITLDSTISELTVLSFNLMIRTDTTLLIRRATQDRY
ncbi:hypothetical protein CF328_g4725 [Tilletia controversa]|nr:hypothetical protein CF328_g4725 [Tilletia controversa]